MKGAERLTWLRRWLRWLFLPPPWWIAGGFVVLLGAVWLCAAASPLAPAMAVAYQIGGAVLAVWQFVSLQKGLNHGREWLTREVREWWGKRPTRRKHVLSSLPGAWSVSSASGQISVWPGEGAPQDEQLRQIWVKLKELTADVDKMDQAQKRHFGELTQLLDRNHKEALAAAEEAKRSVSSALTSAPLKAVFGFWLILLGLGMQVWLALP